ncbi:VanZ family protein [Maribacter algarum]|nr:VanZ family protein [Maribacter algarum]
MVFVTFSSLYSFQGPHVSRFNIPHADKIVHFVFYFVACILGTFFLRERTKGNLPFKKAVVIMILGTIFFGILMEVLQYSMTVTRTGDLLDGLANTTGSFCGGILMKFYFSGKRRLKWEF